MSLSADSLLELIRDDIRLLLKHTEAPALAKNFAALDDLLKQGGQLPRAWQRRKRIEETT